MFKKAIVTYFEALPRCLFRGTEQNYENVSHDGRCPNLDQNQTALQHNLEELLPESTAQ
jgi:hypothetical protein